CCIRCSALAKNWSAGCGERAQAPASQLPKQRSAKLRPCVLRNRGVACWADVAAVVPGVFEPASTVSRIERSFQVQQRDLLCACELAKPFVHLLDVAVDPAAIVLLTE